MELKPTAELVVIGGGIQGTSVAYHLAQKGMTDVSVLEMNTVGSGSSGRSAGMVVHHTFDNSRLDLIRISRDAFRRFRSELGVNPGYERTAYLRLITVTLAQTPPYCAPDSEVGCPSQILNAYEADKVVPGLNLSDVAYALYNDQDGLLDPHSVCGAYASMARRLGVRIYEGVEAIGLRIERDHIRAVETNAGSIATPRVVNAAGPWAWNVGSWANLHLPIRNLKRHIFFVTEPRAFYSRPVPFVHDVEAGWYFRRERPGLIMGMGETPSEEKDPQVEWSYLEEVVDHALYRAPVLADAEVITGWAGFRSVTPDGNPIFGEAPSVKGFFNCCGWGGHGVMHAPAGGQLTAELVLGGPGTSCDITPFLAQRFADTTDSK
jgi:sarcosine oxidase subunit beta